MSTLPRRKILKAAAATALGGMLASEAGAQPVADETENFGGWLSKAAGNKHIPVVSTARDGDEVEVTLEVKHPQGETHVTVAAPPHAAERPLPPTPRADPRRAGR